MRDDDTFKLVEATPARIREWLDTPTPNKAEIERALEVLKTTDYLPRPVQAQAASLWDAAFMAHLEELLRMSYQSAAALRAARAEALAMPTSRLRDLSDDIRAVAPQASEAIENLGQMLPNHSDGNSPLYDWLAGLAPLALNKVFIRAMAVLAALVGLVNAETKNEPPAHLLLVILVLLAIAELWAAKNEGS